MAIIDALDGRDISFASKALLLDTAPIFVRTPSWVLNNIRRVKPRGGWEALTNSRGFCWYDPERDCLWSIVTRDRCKERSTKD